MIIGIDLGTTNSLVALWQQGKCHIIPNPLNLNLTPSAVGIDEDGNILVGQAAKERITTHPNHTAINFKRYMGTDRQILLGNKAFRAEELSAFVIRALKQDAEAYLNTTVTEAVITVPAYFNDTQRKATKAAGELAGLKVERLLNEPTAAAMAYGLHTKDNESKYLVFDLGGGTFDVSILEMFDGMMEVHASGGDNQLGGTDFTATLAEYFINHKAKDLDVNLAQLPAALNESLHVQAEKAKRELCDVGKCEFTLNWQNSTARLAIDEHLFEEIVEPLLERLARPIRGALRDAKVMVSDIDEIILVGGATRMPCIRKLATRLFQRFPAANINPDEVVVQGAAVQAGLKMRDSALNDVVLTDVCPYTLGIEIAEEGLYHTTSGFYRPIIERNNYIPISRVERFYTLQDRQSHVCVKVFQGENPMVKDNIYLGELDVKVPLNASGKESIDVRFTYDINGLLEVQVTVVSTSETHVLVIEENPGILTKEEILACFKKLEQLKIHPRDQQKNKVVLHRSQRLYSELLGESRILLSKHIARFQQVLEMQNSHDIALARKVFEEVLDQIEGAYRF